MPKELGLCFTYVFKSKSRPPLEHITIVPTLGGSQPDLEAVYCSCEGFAYHSKCWHTDMIVDQLIEDEDYGT